MIQLFLALTLTGLRPQFSAMTPCSTGRHLHGIGAGDFGGTRGLSGDPVLPNAVRANDVPCGFVDDLPAFGPIVYRPPSSILGHSVTLPERHLRGVGPGDFWGTRGISSDPLSPNAVRWRDVPVLLSISPKAHKPPELNYWPCPHVFRDGAPRALRGDLGNLQQPMFKKYRPFPRLTGCLRR